LVDDKSKRNLRLKPKSALFYLTQSATIFRLVSDVLSSFV